jgi:hypothetical protein
MGAQASAASRRQEASVSGGREQNYAREGNYWEVTGHADELLPVTEAEASETQAKLQKIKGRHELEIGDPADIQVTVPHTSPIRLFRWPTCVTAEGQLVAVRVHAYSSRWWACARAGSKAVRAPTCVATWVVDLTATWWVQVTRKPRWSLFARLTGHPPLAESATGRARARQPRPLPTLHHRRMGSCRWPPVQVSV